LIIKVDIINGSDSLVYTYISGRTGRGKERGLYPPFSWCWRTQGVGDSFRLEHVKGLEPPSSCIGELRELEPPSVVAFRIGSCSFLSVSGSCRLEPINRGLEPPS
jgi:hypothetical protein